MAFYYTYVRTCVHAYDIVRGQCHAGMACYDHTYVCAVHCARVCMTFWGAGGGCRREIEGGVPHNRDHRALLGILHATNHRLRLS